MGYSNLCLAFQNARSARLLRVSIRLLNTPVVFSSTTPPLHHSITSTIHMPTYTVTVANLSLTAEQENSIAGAITESHHANTGAPGFFAQVLFNAIATGKHFI